MLVPRDAVLEEFGLPFVYVVAEADGSQIVQRRRVTTRSVPFEPASLEVMTGLEVGETIATTSLHQLSDRRRVEARASSAADRTP